MRIAEKYNCAIVDTLNQPMNDVYNEYMKLSGNPGFDGWRDYGVEVYGLYQFIRNTFPNVRLVQVLGKEGSGKTVGARTLDPYTTMYLNCDRKPLTFDEEGELYPIDSPPGKSNSRRNYKEIVPLVKIPGKADPWTPIKDALTYAYNNRAHEKFVIFILAHIEIYKGPNEQMYERLKVLGKQATKLNIEGSLSWCFYTKVDPYEADRSKRFKLLPHGNGYNTARTPMGMFEDVEEIPNDYQLILDRIQGTNKKSVETTNVELNNQ